MIFRLKPLFVGDFHCHISVPEGIESMKPTPVALFQAPASPLVPAPHLPQPPAHLNLLILGKRKDVGDDFFAGEMLKY